MRRTQALLLLAPLTLAACERAAPRAAPVPLRDQVPPTARTHTERVELAVQGMTCSGCEYNVESGLALVTGVVRAEADAAAGRVSVEYDADELDVAELVRAVDAIGYRAQAPAR